MKLSSDIVINAPHERIFEALRDPRFFASCIEGLHDLTEIDDNRYSAILETRVAYLQFRFKVAVALTRVDAPHELEARIEGTPLGMVGRLTATSLTRLTQEGDATTMHYEIEAALTGKLGALGQPVLKAKAKEMEKQFVARLRAAFEEPMAAEAQ
jgi:uncharacterized protein